jgi:hypothetical protein
MLSSVFQFAPQQEGERERVCLSPNAGYQDIPRLVRVGKKWCMDSFYFVVGTCILNVLFYPSFLNISFMARGNLEETMELGEPNESLQKPSLSPSIPLF